jgi:hypothetical protein
MGPLDGIVIPTGQERRQEEGQEVKNVKGDEGRARKVRREGGHDQSTIHACMEMSQ